MGKALAPIPAYVEAQIPIFAFSYGAGADTETLGDMAARTKGRLFITDLDLSFVSRAFQEANALATSAFGIASGKNTAPTGTGISVPFIVDSTIKSFNVVVVYKGNRFAAKFYLQSPAFGPQPNFLYDTQESGGETLQIFEVEKPQAGEWKIIAEGNGAAVPFTYRASGSPRGVTVGFTATRSTFDGNPLLVYPYPMVLRASIGLELPILNAAVVAEVTAPDGTVFELAMKDDGTDTDYSANDGVYSLALNYDQSGVYDLLIRATAQAGTATQDGSMLQASARTDGAFAPIDPPLPLTEDFQRLESLQIQVTGVVPDDHGNTFEAATPLPSDNIVILPGRIESAGDVDMFEISVPTGSMEMVIRVGNLVFEMEPRLSIFNGSGKLVVQGTFLDAQAKAGYLALIVPTSGGETLFASVSHMLPEGTGWYQISAGQVISGDLPAFTQAPTAAPTSVKPQEFKYNLRMGYRFPFVVQRIPTSAEIDGITRLTQVFYRRTIAEQLSLPYNQVNVAFTFLDSTLGGDTVFVNYDAQVFIDRAPDFPTASEVKAHLQFFDTDDYIINFVHLAEPSGSIFEE